LAPTGAEADSSVTNLRQGRTGLRSSQAAGATATQNTLAAAGCAGALACAAAAAGARRRQPKSRQLIACQATPEEWTSRVKAVAGDRCLFDVTIQKPLGLTPKDFPSRSGVGIAAIADGGNTDKLNRRVLIDDEPGMWVLEGDEVVAVNGEPVEGKGLDVVGPLVKESEGDSVTLTLCRAYMQAPVKVVFMPSEKMATMKRGIEIRNAAKVGVEELSYSCQEGWCKTCWQTDEMWGIAYRACSAQSKKRAPPKNPRTIPEEWNSIIPLKLLSWQETVRRAKEKKKAEKARQNA